MRDRTGASGIRRRPFLLTLLAAPVRSEDHSQDHQQLAKLISGTPRLAYQTRTVRVSAPVGYPSAVAKDDKGLFYILHRGDQSDPVLVADDGGRILRSWGKGLFRIPHSIRIDPAGNVWTVDAASSVVMKFTPDGRKLLEIAVGGQPERKSGFAGTTDIAFASGGEVLISDGYGNARVVVYSASGARLREWGSEGSQPGQFRQPHGIATDDRGVVYVADRQNGRLQRFDRNGKYRGEWNHLGMVTTCVYRSGHLWIGTQQRDEPTSGEGWLMRVDPQSGRVLGWLESKRGHHIVNITSAGDLLAGARPDTILVHSPVSGTRH